MIQINRIRADFSNYKRRNEGYPKRQMGKDMQTLLDRIDELEQDNEELQERVEKLTHNLKIFAPDPDFEQRRRELNAEVA